MSSGGGSMGDGFTEKSAPSSSSSSNHHHGHHHSGGRSKPATLQQRIIGCICTPVIVCCVICIVIFAIPIIWIFSITANFSDHQLEWNTPMAMVLSKSTTLNGFGKTFFMEMNYNTARDAPIQAYFVKSKPQIAEGTRLVKYDDAKVSTGNDYQHYNWWLNPGSSVSVSGRYESEETEIDSLRMLAMTKKQFKEFERNATHVLQHGLFLNDWSLKPNDNFEFQFTPTMREADRFYLLHYFRDPRNDNKKKFKEGLFSFEVNMSYFSTPASYEDSCEISSSEAACEVGLGDWNYVLLQQDVGDVVHSTFGSSDLYYKYTKDDAKIYLTLFGILFVILVCCGACLVCIIGISVGIFFLAKKLIGSKGGDDTPSYQPSYPYQPYEQPQQPYQPYPSQPYPPQPYPSQPYPPQPYQNSEPRQYY